MFVIFLGDGSSEHNHKWSFKHFEHDNHNHPDWDNHDSSEEYKRYHWESSESHSEDQDAEHHHFPGCEHDEPVAEDSDIPEPSKQKSGSSSSSEGTSPISRKLHSVVNWNKELGLDFEGQENHEDDRRENNWGHDDSISWDNKRKDSNEDDQFIRGHSSHEDSGDSNHNNWENNEWGDNGSSDEDNRHPNRNRDGTNSHSSEGNWWNHQQSSEDRQHSEHKKW